MSLTAPPQRASGEEGRLRYAPAPLLPRNARLNPLLAPFYSATVVPFYAALDNGGIEPVAQIRTGV